MDTVSGDDMISTDKETEMQTLERTKSYMKWQTILLGGASLATFLAVLALASIGVYLLLFEGRASHRLMILAGAGGLVPVMMAFAAWIVYFIFRYSYPKPSP